MALAQFLGYRSHLRRRPGGVNKPGGAIEITGLRGVLVVYWRIGISARATVAHTRLLAWRLSRGELFIDEMVVHLNYSR